MENRITPDKAGCWLEGSQGWTNHYRVVYLAQSYGFKIDKSDEKEVDRYRADHGMSESGEAITGQGGLVDKATEYLESLAPVGFHFEWDMGELSLLPCSEIEGHGPDCEEE